MERAAFIAPTLGGAPVVGLAYELPPLSVLSDTDVEERAAEPFRRSSAVAADCAWRAKKADGNSVARVRHQEASCCGACR